MDVINKKGFTLLETLIALSILIMLLPLVSSIFYGSVKRYLRYSEENKEIAQVRFAESYLNMISKDADSMQMVGACLQIKIGTTIHEIGVKNKKLYAMQTATRYLTIEPMLITNYKFIKINDYYYQIELQTQTNRKYGLSIIN